MSKAQRPSPQLILTLSPQGGLIAELPGANGTRRQIPLTAAAAGATALRILHAQAAGPSHQQQSIGLDAAPTQAQVRHWEQHAAQPSATCQWCIAEGTAASAPTSTRRRPKLISEAAGVIIRVLQPQGPQAKAKPLQHAAEDIGL